MYKIDDCLLIETLYGKDFIERVADALLQSHAVLLYGPPGTGKTALARCLAKKLSEYLGETVELVSVTVHGWFTRHQLIGGLVLQGGSTIWQDGVILRAAKSGRPTLVLLDEVNRGEPERFMAELLTALADPELRLCVPEEESTSAGKSLAEEQDQNVVTVVTAGHPLNVIWAISEWAFRRNRAGYAYTPIYWAFPAEYKRDLEYIRQLTDSGLRVLLCVYVLWRLRNLRLLGFCGEVAECLPDRRDLAQYWPLTRIGSREHAFPHFIKLRPIIVNELLISYHVLSELEKTCRSEQTSTDMYMPPDSLRKLFNEKLAGEGDVADYVLDKERLHVLDKIREIAEKSKPLLESTLLLLPEGSLGTRTPGVPISYIRFAVCVNAVRVIKHALERVPILRDFVKILEPRTDNTSSRNHCYSLSHVYIVATANSADVTALGRLGFALLRRFVVVEVVFDLEKQHEEFKHLLQRLGVDVTDDLLQDCRQIWDRLKSILLSRYYDKARYLLPGWSYFVDYVRARLRLRKHRIPDDKARLEAFREVFYGYIRNLDIRIEDVLS